MKKIDIKKLWQRVFTALLYAPIFIIAVYLGGFPFFIGMVLLSFVALQEMYTMYATAKKNIESYHFGYLLLILIITSAYLSEINYFWNTALPVLLTGFICLFFLLELFYKKVFFIENRHFFMLRAVAYVGTIAAYAILIRETVAPLDGFYHLIYILLVVWANDTFAYLIGMPLGRHRLSPEISPKKSIEGALGAVLGAVLMSVSLKMLIGVSLMTSVFLAVFISVLAQCGDLIESLLKRNLHAKDSGSFMMSHGGVLDRVDSFFLTLPFFYIFINNFIK